MQNIINYDDKVALYENSDIADINKVNASDMNEIKSIVNGSLQGTNAMGSIVVDDVKCKNMYGPVMTGIIMNNSGVETANNDWQSTPYIEVNSLTDYYYSYTTNNPQSVMGLVTEYNSSKTFIKQTVINADTHTIQTTSTTKYVRLSNRADINMTNIQFELGSTATNYVEYKEPVKITNIGVKENTTFYANDFKCKNMLPMASSQTINGVTFTVNQDGTITLSGTATRVVFFPIKGANDLFQYIQGQTYTLSGCPAGGDYSNKYSLYTDIGAQKESDEGEGITFTATRTTGTIYIVVRSGQNVNGLVFKPQLEIGSEATPYTPYKNFENEEIYSTNEVKIGTWVDGKPLYRKVFTITSLTSSNTNLVDVSGLSIDFAKISGTIITSTGAKFPINLYDSASNYSVIILSDAGYIRGRAAIGSGTLSKCIVILEYTKTTD